MIVGVGNSNFSAMNMLDADETPLYDPITDTYSSRDIVQFVPFNKYKSSPEKLAEETLAEIPKQLTDFMAYREIKPNARVVINDNFVYGESEVYVEQ